MVRFGSIYLITNQLNGLQYVGQTQNSVQQRFYDHSRDHRSSRYLSSAMMKYGKENFSLEELFVAFDENSLNEAETLLISTHNTLYPNGYNLSMGGHKRGIISALTRDRMSKAKKGRTFTKKIRPDQAQKINASRQRGGKPLVAINLVTKEIRHYNYVREVKKDGFHDGDVYRVLRGDRNHAHGWSFKYVSEYDNQSGSVENKKSSHAQRIELETLIKENK